MFTKFWDKVAEGLAGRWAAQALGPALVFWGGGVLAWACRNGWQRLLCWLAAVDNTAAYIALAVGGLLLLAVSSAAATWLQLTVLRLAEGYWPGLLRGPRFALARQLEKRLRAKDKRWQELAAVASGVPTAEQRAEYARLDAELARYPVDPRHLMPTRVGNLLRAAEEYTQVRYGLAMGTCWPRLWLLLPEETQNTLGEARQRLNGTARFGLWSVLFAVWTVWAWWAVPVALAGAVVAYWGMVSAAGVYGELLRATLICTVSRCTRRCAGRCRKGRMARKPTASS